MTETTGRVIGERRLRTLRELAAQVAQAATAEEACRQAAQTLAAQNPADVPFALLYLLSKDGCQAQLAGCCGIAPGTPASPQHIIFPEGMSGDDVSADGARSNAGWPLAQVAQTGQLCLVSELLTRFDPLPGGPWPDPPHSALVLPIAAPSGPALAGLLVAGLNPCRALDSEYQGFLVLLASHVATAIANARAYEEEKRRAEALAELDRAKTTLGPMPCLISLPPAPAIHLCSKSVMCAKTVRSFGYITASLPCATQPALYAR